MRMPDVVTDPANIFSIFAWAHAEFFAAVGNVLGVFGQVRVQTNAVTAGQFGRRTHQVVGNTERGTGSQADPQHGEAFGVVIGFNQASRIAQNCLFLFHHIIRRQPAFTLAQTHAPAHSVEAYPNFLGAFNLTTEPTVIRKNVRRVARSRTA